MATDVFILGYIRLLCPVLGVTSYKVSIAYLSQHCQSQTLIYSNVSLPNYSQPAFQRWFTGESTSGTMVESTLDYVSILQIGSTLILWRCFTAKSWRCFTVEIVTLFHRLTGSIGELRSFCRRWINVELCVDFANWINVDNTTLFHRRTFNMNEYTTVTLHSIRT